MLNRSDSWPKTLANKYFCSNGYVNHQEEQSVDPVSNPTAQSKDKPSFLERIEQMEKDGIFPKGSLAKIETGEIKISQKDEAVFQLQNDTMFTYLGRLILGRERVRFSRAWRLLTKKSLEYEISLLDYAHLLLSQGLKRGSLTFRGFRVIVEELDDTGSRRKRTSLERKNESWCFWLPRKANDR